MNINKLNAKRIFPKIQNVEALRTVKNKIPFQKIINCCNKSLSQQMKLIALLLFPLCAIPAFAEINTETTSEEALQNSQELNHANYKSTEINATNGVSISGPYAEFSVTHTDLELTSNSTLDLVLSRSYAKGIAIAFDAGKQKVLGGTQRSQVYSGLQLMGDWNLNIPHITGFDPRFTCDQQLLFPDGPFEEGSSLTGTALSLQISGVNHPIIQFNEPSKSGGTVTQEMFDKYAMTIEFGPTSSQKSYHTQSNWKFKVDPLGEGCKIIGYSPDGSIYTFSQLTQWAVARNPVYQPEVHKLFFGQTPTISAALVTEIKDRFGNTTIFDYDDFGRVNAITSSDGINVTFEYDYIDPISYPDEDMAALFASSPHARIKKIHYNGKTIEYKYSREIQHGGGALVFYPHWNSTLPVLEDSVVDLGTLTSVIYPDGSKWQINSELPQAISRPSTNSTLEWNYEITNPMGYKTVYRLATTEVRDFSENIYNCYKHKPAWEIQPGDVNLCKAPLVTVKSMQAFNPNYQISYDFKEDNPNGHSKFSTVTETYPTHTSVKMYTIQKGWRYGKLEQETTYSAAGVLLSTTNYDYKKEYSGLKAPKLINNLLETERDPWDYDHSIDWENIITRSFLKEKTTVQDGTTYKTEYLEYNDYGQVTKIKETGPSGNYFTQKGYIHDQDNWVLNLPTTIEISDKDSSYTETSKIVYSDVPASNFPNTTAAQKLPYEQHNFGTWTERFASYLSDGNIKKVESNIALTTGTGNRFTEYTSYKRGIAQNMSLPSRLSSSTMSQSKVVNNSGWVTQTTDLNGNIINYGYDETGRLKYLDPADSAFSDIYISWSFNGGANNDLPVKKEHHCTLTSTKNACQDTPLHTSTTTYDGLLRPLLLETSDDTNSVYVNRNYDSNGNLTFESFPSTSPTESSGTSYTYDGLGRLDTVVTTGGGTIAYDYLSGNKIKVTDALSNETTTTFRAFGEPTYNQATKIASPEDVTTDIDVDIFGNIQSIKQQSSSGGYNADQIEYRAYDSQKHLCQIKRSDTGTVVYKRNNIGEIEWMAQGQIASNNTSCNTTASAVEKVTYTYDNLGSQHTIAYGDGTPTRTFSYDNNGNIKTISSTEYTQSYNYNSMNLLEDETLAVDNKIMVLDYEYNKLAHLSSMSYPDGLPAVELLPNSFGHPTQAIRNYSDTTTDIFVKGGQNKATYHPNGIIDSFEYGNGVIHKTTLNTRNIPSCILDYTGTEPVCGIDNSIVNLDYEYDNNLNVTSITNPKDSGIYSLSNLTYDGLDRLTSTTGGVGIGSSAISYDGLGNIRSYTNDSVFKSHSLTYAYNTNNRLTTLTGTGSDGYNFNGSDSYDSAGNVTHNGKHSFTYNLANQMISSGSNNYLYDGYNRRIKTQNNKGISYSMYSQSGKLMYRETELGGINYIYLGKKLVAKEGTGVVIAEDSLMNYKPFGESIEEPKDDIGYTGHKFDTDLGLSYMQARYYDPAIGRFYSNDPVSWSPESPIHSFGRYTYVNNNPYKYKDPNGEWAVQVIGFLVGAGMDVYDQYTEKGSFSEINPAQTLYAGAFGAVGGGVAKYFVGSVKAAAGNKGLQTTLTSIGIAAEATIAAGNGAIKDSLSDQSPPVIENNAAVNATASVATSVLGPQAGNFAAQQVTKRGGSEKEAKAADKLAEKALEMAIDEFAERFMY
ncbi:RHS repeat-associated core domain-containing protein [Thalassomonas viridans]|uniref:RHS repeat-associated core domain-containing protein n=1 Tax=Thalassomonas viridans TaxID=137584 RepID=A0AAF0CAB0_9GAMM|nr:RHS repeat-associated core domain-containing protein [Thalassomonas viridans]WDE06105.1 RHS repeat-associated core domain-containing protein [Thalassomonas viridans]